MRSAAILEDLLSGPPEVSAFSEELCASGECGDVTVRSAVARSLTIASLALAADAVMLARRCWNEPGRGGGGGGGGTAV